MCKKSTKKDYIRFCKLLHSEFVLVTEIMSECYANGSSVLAYLVILMHSMYTVSQKKACDYIFCNNLNNECPIIIIFGTLINETICHRMVVSFPTSSI